MPLLSLRRDVAKLSGSTGCMHCLRVALRDFLTVRRFPGVLRVGSCCLAGFVMTFGHHWLLSHVTRLMHLTLGPAFVIALVSAVNETLGGSVLGGTPLYLRGLLDQASVGLYNHVNEGAVVKEYLRRHTDGHHVENIRFQFRSGSGTFMLTHRPSLMLMRRTQRPIFSVIDLLLVLACLPISYMKPFTDVTPPPLWGCCVAGRQATGIGYRGVLNRCRECLQ